LRHRGRQFQFCHGNLYSTYCIEFDYGRLATHMRQKRIYTHDMCTKISHTDNGLLMV